MNFGKAPEKTQKTKLQQQKLTRWRQEASTFLPQPPWLIIKLGAEDDIYGNSVFQISIALLHLTVVFLNCKLHEKVYMWEKNGVTLKSASGG